MSLDRQPTLIGERVRLRPLRPEDFEALVAAASDPLIWEQHPQHDRYKPKVFKDFFDRAIASEGALAIFDKTSDEIIGSSRFHLSETSGEAIEIGWTFITRRYWGRGYNAEIKQLMLAHVFAVLDHVIFHVGERNFRSQKAVEKLGAHIIGTREGQDKKVDLVYRLDADAYSTIT